MCLQAQFGRASKPTGGFEYTEPLQRRTEYTLNSQEFAQVQAAWGSGGAAPRPPLTVPSTAPHLWWTGVANGGSSSLGAASPSPAIGIISAAAAATAVDAATSQPASSMFSSATSQEELAEERLQSFGVASTWQQPPMGGGARGGTGGGNWPGFAAPPAAAKVVASSAATATTAAAHSAAAASASTSTSAARSAAAALMHSFGRVDLGGAQWGASADNSNGADPPADPLFSRGMDLGGAQWGAADSGAGLPLMADALHILGEGGYSSASLAHNPLPPMGTRGELLLPSAASPPDLFSAWQLLSAHQRQQQQQMLTKHSTDTGRSLMGTAATGVPSSSSSPWALTDNRRLAQSPMAIASFLEPSASSTMAGGAGAAGVFSSSGWVDTSPTVAGGTVGGSLAFGGGFSGFGTAPSLNGGKEGGMEQTLMPAAASAAVASNPSALNPAAAPYRLPASGFLALPDGRKLPRSSWMQDGDGGGPTAVADSAAPPDYSLHMMHCWGQQYDQGQQYNQGQQYSVDGPIAGGNGGLYADASGSYFAAPAADRWRLDAGGDPSYWAAMAAAAAAKEGEDEHPALPEELTFSPAASPGASAPLPPRFR